MKRFIFALLAALTLTAVCTQPAYAYDIASEQAEAFGTAALESALPAQTYDAFGALSVADAAHPRPLLQKLWGYALREGGGALASAARNAALLLAVVFLAALCASLSASGACAKVTQMTGAVAVAALSVTHVTSCITAGSSALTTLRDFSKILLPSMCAAAAASGAATSAAAKYAATSLFLDVLLSAETAVLLPMLYTYAGTVICGAALEQDVLTALSALLRKALRLLLIGFAGVFTLYLSLTGILTGSADAAAAKAVKTAGWDGEWFVRAYDAYSRKVGTHEDTEGQIYIEPQGMCVMAGIGLDDGKAQQALKSVKERLTCDWGTAILAPAYSTYRIELGEISSYPRGYKENGGIFCHNNPWISIANAIAGNDDEAFAVYQRNCPAYVEDKSDVRKVEPYVYCQMVAGPEAATPGEGKNSWLTGTAAWTFVDVSQYLLGVRPTLDGLAIEPHLPERFDQLTVTRVFRGVTYRIAMKRTGERTVSVDGAKIGGNVVPALSDAKSVDVEVTF